MPATLDARSSQHVTVPTAVSSQLDYISASEWEPWEQRPSQCVFITRGCKDDAMYVNVTTSADLVHALRRLMRTIGSVCAINA
eukprot:4297425-Amphidinium_carterae.2